MSLRALTGLALGTALAACGGAYGRVSEIESSTIRGDSFQTVVVISGDDDQNSLQITARVRQQLNDKGVTAERRSGIWNTEAEALTDICPMGGTSAVDGLLFVFWNQLSLYDCGTHKPAYQVRGGMRGTDVMVQHLMRYLRPRG